MKGSVSNRRLWVKEKVNVTTKENFPSVAQVFSKFIDLIASLGSCIDKYESFFEKQLFEITDNEIFDIHDLYSKMLAYLHELVKEIEDLKKGLSQNMFADFSSTLIPEMQPQDIKNPTYSIERSEKK